MTDTARHDFRTPTLCLVTPGARPGDTDTWSLDALVGLVHRAIEAGVDLVQIREPQLAARHLYDLAVQAVQRSRGKATRVVVNDRLDVALAAGADGVHLGRHSLPAARVRAAVPQGFLVGCSVHSLEELRGLHGPSVDYAIAGTVYATKSKPADTPLLGADGFGSLARVTDLPLLAIGGVTLERIPELAQAGAAGIAAIGLFAEADETSLAAVVNDVRGALTRYGQFPKLSHAENSASPHTKADR